MKNIHIVLKNVLKNGKREQIVISNVGSVSNDDMFLKIYSDEELPTAHPPMSKFDLSEIIGYWFEKAGE